MLWSGREFSQGFVKAKIQVSVKWSQVKPDKCQVSVTKMEFSQLLVKLLERIPGIAHTNNFESQDEVY